MAALLSNQWKSKVVGRHHESDQISLTFHLTADAFPCWYVEVSSKNASPLPAYTSSQTPLLEHLLLDARLPGGLFVVGELRLHETSSKGFLVVAESLRYGFSEEVTSERSELGTIALLRSDAPPEPVPEPGPVPDPGGLPEKASEPETFIEPAVGGEGELFPYVSLRLWPEPSPEELARGFVFYPARTPLPQALLVPQWIDARSSQAPDARDQMKRAAISYIEGGGPGGAPFVSRPEALPMPWAVYPDISRLAARCEDGDVERVLGRIQELLGFPLEQARASLATDASLQVLASVWQSYFALVIETGYDARARQELAQLLAVDHLLRWLGEHAAKIPTGGELRTLARATPVLPASIFPLPPEGIVGASPPVESTDRVLPYALGDLRQVRQRFVRYALGDVARVESLMAGEWRKSVRRNAQSASQSSLGGELDTTERSTSGRTHALTQEMSQAIADIVSTTSYGTGSNGFTITYGPPGTGNNPATTGYTGGWQLNTGPQVTNGEPSKSATSRAARRLVQQAAERVAHQVVARRTTRSTRETEETFISVLDNKRGTTGRRGVYRWLNEVYEACIVQYGNRFVLELLLAAPASHYLDAQRDEDGGRSPPVPPEALHILSFEDISPENFPELAARYPAAALELPPATQTVSAWARVGEPLSLAQPEGYVARVAWLSYVVPAGHGPLELQGLVGQTPVALSAVATGSLRQPLGGEGGQVQVLLQDVTPPASPPVEPSSPPIAVELESAPGEALLRQWRLKTFRAIHQSHAAQVRAFQAESPGEDASERGPRPRVSFRTVERRELKQGAFALFIQRMRAHVGMDPQALPSGWPSRVDPSLPRYLQFLEGHFEWSEMSYLFLPPVRGQGPQPQGSAPLAVGDARFTEFLEAAYAQVLLPVAPGKALAVLYFLASGSLWGPSDEGIPVHEADVPLANELGKLRPEPCEVQPVGKPWTVVVPTALTVLQDGPEALGGVDAWGNRPSLEESGT